MAYAPHGSPTTHPLSTEDSLLTGLPRGNWAAPQKVRWAAEHFPGTRIITCMAVNKRDHGRKGDVLVDDTLKHRHLWEEAGGIFVHHRSAAESLAMLREIGLLAPEPVASAGALP